jgi:hypothetical protein
MAETFLIASAVIGAATSAVGAIQQGQAQDAQARHQAALSDRQATIEEQNRVAALQQGAEDERRTRQQQRYVLAQRQAAAGQSGIDPGFGSPLLVGEQAEIDAELNALTTRYQSQLAARGYGLRAEGARADAGMFRAAGANARRAGYVGAGTALLSGAARVGGMMYAPGGGGGGGGGSGGLGFAQHTRNTGGLY